MAKSLPIRLRTIAAAMTVIASGLIIWNAYQSIIGSSDGDSAAVPIIFADVEPFRVVPKDPGGADIPNKNSRLYNVLNAENADDLALDGVSLPKDVDDHDMDDFITGDVMGVDGAQEQGQGFSLPDIPEPKTESLYGSITQLKDKQVIADDPELQEMPEETRGELIKKLDVVIEEKTIKEPNDAKIIEPKVNIVTVPTPSKKPKIATKPRHKVTEQPKQKQKFSIDRVLATAPTENRHYIQLASLKDEQAARATYTRIRTQFPNLVAGASVFYPQVDLGARGTFTRIQVGPFNGEEARKRCADYTTAAGGGTCLVVSR